MVALFDLIFGIVNGLFSVLPDINWSIDNAAFQSFVGMTKIALYLLPMGTVLTILNIVIWITIFRIIISVIKTLWELLPVV